MKRRDFLAAVPAAAAGTTIAMPAIAQSMPEIKWRLTSSFPKSLDTLYGVSEVFARHVAEMTDNRFQIQCFAPGEIVPALQAADAVTNGTLEMCHTAAYYFVGKDPAFAFGTAIPFGLNARQQSAWFTNGDGQKLFNDFVAKYNIHSIMCGNTGAQMGGWFRKEIKSLEDMKGLKFRIGGFAGRVVQRVGGVPQQIAGGDIYPALEKGTIDGAEWVGPHDDEKLGFAKVAPFYYYPGWWEGGAALCVMVNREKWTGLPKAYQAIINAAAHEAGNWCMGRYDTQNPLALKRLVAAGTQLRPFPADVMEACWKAAHEIYAEESARNPHFKALWESQSAFRGDSYLWWQVAELTYDTFQIRQRARG
ncbi:TRAP transporter substrate-binding protein [Rhabdaerophilum calidifontis]|uniref:TRAP transporter substrate-binding protein n=1 Tax=Rhabdaerophilum calidifontis TaxID=2604328 RepID=UPI00123B7A69|nr:TRAP transporter substrate-binding protein [Rhabdaerophilum calidifontis]